ncbi:cxxc_20_cxxc protein [Muriicola jejuensis]|uniref:Uncharacterized protein n=1 Tax=Muriicola jejuensis TaxID=504488 RepID=A0A6P0UIK2_9FLAO|nr:hypothetical protein [Muriicola jejuensis]SMP25808.1 cxxc_20_cxxc protein [Muriicola jejuensis]
MQSCENCKQKFSFGQIYKSFLIGYKPLVCKNCKTKYEHTFKNRWIGAGSVGLGVFFGGISQFYFEPSSGYKLMVGIIVTIFTVSLISAICVSFMTFEREEKKNYT